MGSEQNRFPLLPHHHRGGERRKRWGGCLSALSCFGNSKKGGKRIVPSTRITDGLGLGLGLGLVNGSATQGQVNGNMNVNGIGNVTQQVGIINHVHSQSTALLAPPSSPASFINSAIPSTVQSPTCFLSANSPVASPSSIMFATGPYAHETQLVSPPVLSTFTTEPSTAPLTPPPELAHLTTPSSPDVPFARFLSSSSHSHKHYLGTATLNPHPHPQTPSTLVSRASNDCSSSSYPDNYWDPSLSPQNAPASQDSNFFCPATFAQFYLDNPPFPHAAGRLSVSKDSDAYSNAGNTLQHKQTRSPKQDADEIEAYRASFGFSADEIITTTQYVEISDVMDDSFSMTPFTSTKLPIEETMEPVVVTGLKPLKTQANLQSQNVFKLPLEQGSRSDTIQVPNGCQDHKKRQTGDNSGSATLGNYNLSDEEDIFAKMGSLRTSRKYQVGLSSSDAEVDYRRGRSLRERKVTWLAK